MRSVFLGLVLASAGCTSAFDVDACTTPGCVPPIPPVALSTTVSGDVVDVDLYTSYLRAHPTATKLEAVAMSAIAGAPVYALFVGGRTPVVLSDGTGHYALEVPRGVAFHLVTMTDERTRLVGTFDQAARVAETTTLTDATVSTFAATSHCSIVGLAAALGVEVSDVQRNGACIVATSASTMLSVTGAPDLRVWAVTDTDTKPPLLTEENASVLGYYAVFGSESMDVQTLSIEVTGATAFPVASCQLIPGMITFAELSGT